MGIQKLDELNPLAIAVNCISYTRFKKLIEEGADIIKNLKSGFGFYLNCGDQQKYETNYLANIWDVAINPQEYIQILKNLSILNLFLLVIVVYQHLNIQKNLLNIL